jgi:hypothetical protein
MRRSRMAWTDHATTPASESAEFLEPIAVEPGINLGSWGTNIRSLDMNSVRTGRLAPAALVFACLGLGGIAVAGSPRGPAGNHECDLAPALDAPKPPFTDGPIVQLALLLDTSNSMDGLIDQARSHLWSVVNDLSRLRQGCRPVQLQVALFQYGNDGLESSDGFVQLRAPFTTNLDIISEQLFSLRTHGGSEYCGWVIRDAAERLDWIPPREDCAGAPVMRLIVIAGNEPFTQGSIPYSSSIPTATNKGVTVHTVFCGGREEGAATFWDDGAALGEGRYCSIDSHQSRIEIPTPFDGRISSLNSRLNGTYVPYGTEGRLAVSRQSAQDANYADSPSSLTERAAAKASALYRNESWDLVDAAAQEGFELNQVERETLPPEWQSLDEAHLAAALKEKSDARRRIQEEIRDLTAQRLLFLADKQTRSPAADLGDALVAAIREQAEAKGLITESDE